MEASGAMLVAIQGVDAGLLATAFTLGLRHGIDWDHVAAISDLATNQSKARRSIRLATVYAAGHASVVVLLGSVAVLAGDVLPGPVDAVMGRVVGVTLLVLGGYVVVGLVQHGAEFTIRSRWAVVGALLRAASRRVRRETEVVVEHDHEHGPNHGHRHLDANRAVHGLEVGVAMATTHRHAHVHRGTLPPDPSERGGTAAFTIGVLHGIGSETPTQVLLFVAAAGAAGALVGELVLVAFTLGLFAANTAIAVAASAGFLHAGQHRGIYVGVAATTAALSLVLGTLYLIGIEVLPPFLEG